MDEAIDKLLNHSLLVVIWKHHRANSLNRGNSEIRLITNIFYRGGLSDNDPKISPLQHPASANWMMVDDKYLVRQGKYVYCEDQVKR